jgi:hypothetical protein
MKKFFYLMILQWSKNKLNKKLLNQHPENPNILFWVDYNSWNLYQVIYLLDILPKVKLNMMILIKKMVLIQNWCWVWLLLVIYKIKDLGIILIIKVKINILKMKMLEMHLIWLYYTIIHHINNKVINDFFFT